MPGVNWQAQKISRSRYRDAKLVKLTPTEAKKLRTTGTPVEQLNADKVDALLAELQADNWQPNLHRNQPVKLSAEGQLLNGNHRTEAISRYGKTVEVWIWRNPSGHNQP